MYVYFKYRLDDGSRQLWDLDHCGNLCIDAECAAQGIVFGFQGDLNPMILSTVFILQQWGNEKYDVNTPPVDMAEKRLIWPLLVGAWTATVMKILIFFSEERYQAN